MVVASHESLRGRIAPEAIQPLTNDSYRIATRGCAPLAMTTVGLESARDSRLATFFKRDDD